MSVGFQVKSAVKSVSLFQNWKLFIIPVFVFWWGVMIKQRQKRCLHVPYGRLPSIIRLAES